MNAVEAGRFSRKRNPRRVRCLESNERRNPSELRHRRSVLRGPCNSNNSSSGRNRSNGRNSSDRNSSDRNSSSDHNHSLKPNALPDLRNSNGRKANALAVRPNDRSKTRGRNRNRSRSIRAAHLLNAAAEVAKASPANPANRRNAKDTDGDVQSLTIRVNPPPAHSRN